MPPTTEAPPAEVALTPGPEPEVALVLSTETPDPALRATPSWQITLPGSRVTGATATDELVAVVLPDENLVVGLDRRTGAERWRYMIPEEQSNVRLERRAGRVVVRVEVGGRDEVITELGVDGAPLWRWDASAMGLPMLTLTGQDLYVANAVSSGRVGQFVIDPDQDPPIIDEWVGAAIGRGLDLVPAVAEDGVVSLIDVASRARSSTGIVVDPTVESIAYVDGMVVAYDEDLLTAFRLDGSAVWQATYPASPTDVELFPVGSDSSAFALAEVGSGATVIDVQTGSVLWTSALSSAGVPFTSAGRLYAVASDGRTGASGLLDFAAGTLVVTDGPPGSVRATDQGFVLSTPSALSGSALTLWTDRDGTPTMYLDTLVSGDTSTLLDGLYVQIDSDSSGSTVTAFEVPT